MMKRLATRTFAYVLAIQWVLCYKNLLRSRTFQIPHFKPLNAGPATTSWSYKTLPQDFIVIEDRVLESYGQNFSSKSSGISDPNAPDVGQLELAAVLGEEQLNKLIVLSQSSQSSWSGLESVTLKISPALWTVDRTPTCQILFNDKTTLSKEERTKFHQNIRKTYPTVDSKTELKDANEQERACTYILLYPKGAKSLVNPNDAANAEYYDDNRRGGKKKVVVQRWDRNKPDYLHFTVVKCMLSTSEMVDKLAKMTSMLPTRFEFCGSKDKRALTFQRVSSWRVDQDVVARVSSDSMFVRDVCVAQSPLRLGDLSGNFFAITLRKEEGSNTQNSLTITGQPSASSLLSSFAAVASYPFMNIFGVQRFGSPLPSNPEVGMRLLASDYRGAVLMLLLAPSTASELEAGNLDLKLLNSWLDGAMDAERKSRDSDASRKPGELPGYFRYLSAKFEDYKSLLEAAIEDGKLVVSSGEEEKIGDEWNAIINTEEKNENEKRDARRESEPMQDMRELDDSVTEEDAAALDDLYSTTVSTSVIPRKKSVASQKQKNAVRDLRERLQSLSDLLQGRPFDSPKSSTFLQKKILSQLYEEMAKKCEGDLLRVNFSRVFSVLPQALRQLFVNSYQSLLWNEIALDRLKDNKHNAVLNPTEKGKKNKSKKSEVVQSDTIATDVSYLKSSVVELKAILKDRGLKVSGKKEELVARLTAHDADNTSSSSSSSSSSSTDASMEEHSSPTGFLVTDTAVVGDIVLVDLAKRPLTAWHVAAQNISLNGNHILEWSEGVGTVKATVPVQVPMVINSNTPFNMNPNSPFYKGEREKVGGLGDRGDSRGGRGGGRDDRGRRGEVEEVEAKEDVRELKACYHAVTREDERLRLYPVESVIVALPGASVYTPAGSKMCQRVAADNMEVLLSGMHHDKIFRLPGAYRHLVTVAKNVRLAPVHTSKTKLPHFDDDRDDVRSVDEDIVYDSWSYSRPNEPSSHSVDSSDTSAEETLDPVIPDRPLWTKVVEPSSPLKAAPAVAEDPFSGHVESMWDSDIIPELLYDVYSGSSSAAHAKNIGLLPAVLTKTIDPKGMQGLGGEEAGSPELGGEKEGGRGDAEVEGFRISFTLCASTYATTFLDHIVETINKKQLP